MRALDATLVHQAGELDILCGYAVALLSRPAGRTAELLDLLGMLDPDHLLAVYFALPEDRRHAVMRDFVCAYHVHRAPAAAIESRDARAGSTRRRADQRAEPGASAAGLV
jgi:hypothetical protein